MADDLTRLFPTWRDGEPWPLTYEDGNRTRIRREKLRSYVPNSREQMVNAINDAFYDGGREGNRYAENVAMLLDLPLGLGHSVYDMTRAASEGRPREAAMSLAMALPPPPVRKAARQASRTIEETLAKHNSFVPDPRSKPDGEIRSGPLDALAEKDRNERLAASQAPAPATPSIIRPGTGPVEPGPQSQSGKGGPVDWDSIVFEPPTPGAFWQQRSTPWVVAKGPLAKTPREFALDYPDEPLTDEAGRLLKDISGNDLVAKHIAGRVRKGERDQGLKPAAIRSIIEDDLKIPVLRVPKSELPGNALGDVSAFGGPWSVRIWDRLPQDQSDVALAHEFGHIIHALTGWKRPKGLAPELNRLFSENYTGQLRPGKPGTPRNAGYSDGDWQYLERMAEAIRTASVNPNTLKSIAPKTGAFLREIINTHPVLSKILQLNDIPIGITAGAAGAALLGTGGQAGQSQAAEATPRRNSSGIPGGSFEPLPGPSTPPGLADQAMKAGAFGLAAIAKALSRREPSSPAR